jgi:type I restriction enzyme R subunit
MAKLDPAGIYQEPEAEGLVTDYVANKGNNTLTKWVTPARNRFRDRERDSHGPDFHFAP